jgi:DNA mismatch repair protein MutS
MLDTLGKKIKCLLDIVDNTSTAMGHRYLKNMLSVPLINEDEIQNIYDITETLIQNNEYKKYKELLCSISDIEKIYRKLLIGIIKPDELYNFIQSLKVLQKINLKIQKNDTLDDFLGYSELINKIDFVINFCEETFDVEKLKIACSDNNISYYHENVHKDIDEIYYNINSNIEFINKLGEKLSEIAGKQNYISVKKNERDGYYYCITKARCKQFQERLTKITNINVNDVQINVNSIEFKPNIVGIVKIIVSEVEHASDEIVSLGKTLQGKLKNYFFEDLNKISASYNKYIRNAIAFISKFDYYVSNAHTAIKYNYTRPILDVREGAFISCKQIRHPIIERIIEHEYVAHDITIGTDKMKGILLYGLNSSGKSSIMKAIGISIIMAQAGMYVPASKFKYSPYSSIFTRISGNDNLFKELSSFSVEMTELKAIWKRSDENTLVIGDEVCRGTEHISGNAIVATTLLKLSQKKSTFIFATHLHDIIKLKEIKDAKNIKAFYLSVTFDEKNDRLIFDRTLKEGSGEEIYGITVAKYIIQDNEFTETANEIKNELTGMSGKIINTKSSKYNSDVYVNKCAVCNQEFQCKNDVMILDTHHIHQQKDCENGVVKDKKFIKKNSKCNLIVLCKSCHNKIHDGEINIESIASSTDGNILVN